MERMTLAQYRRRERLRSAWSAVLTALRLRNRPADVRLFRMIQAAVALSPAFRESPEYIAWCCHDGMRLLNKVDL